MIDLQGSVGRTRRNGLAFGRGRSCLGSFAPRTYRRVTNLRGFSQSGLWCLRRARAGDERGTEATGGTGAGTTQTGGRRPPPMRTNPLTDAAAFALAAASLHDVASRLPKDSPAGRVLIDLATGLEQPVARRRSPLAVELERLTALSRAAAVRLRQRGEHRSADLLDRRAHCVAWTLDDESRPEPRRATRRGLLRAL
jgi:hypothetical protein